MEGRCQVANVSVTVDTIIPGAYIAIVPSQLTLISIITCVKHDYFMKIALISVCKNLGSLCFSPPPIALENLKALYGLEKVTCPSDCLRVYFFAF